MQWILALDVDKAGHSVCSGDPGSLGNPGVAAGATYPFEGRSCVRPIKANRARLLATWVGLVIAAGAVLPSIALPEVSLPGDMELRNLEHVFNFNPNLHDPGRHEYAGADLEFFTTTVPLRDYSTGRYVDAAGSELPEFDPEGNPTQPLYAEKDFAVVGSYQRGAYIFDITDPENTRFVSRVTCPQEQNDVNLKKFIDSNGKTRVVLAMTQQRGLPCDGGQVLGPGIRVNTAGGPLGTFHGPQWDGTAPIDAQTGEMVYVGSGCTAASYVGKDVRGKIALASSRYGSFADQCPTYLFKQKADAAELAGAIALVHIDDDDIPEPSATAIISGIPVIEIGNLDGTKIQDALCCGGTVTGTLVDMVISPRSKPLHGGYGAGDGGIGVFDISDPYEWTQMYGVRGGFGGVHNFTFHPTKPYGYISNGALPGLINEIPIVDFTDLDRPNLITGLVDTIGGVHDIEFSLDGERAFVASENNYVILDTTDPAHPTQVSITPNGGTYAHTMFPTSDRRLMVSNNESLALGGFFASAALCPGEGLASYGIEGDDERSPRGPLGYFVPDVVGPAVDGRPCTSHVGRFAEDSSVMAVAWYIGGTRVVDWADPADPKEVASAVMDGANTWASKFYKGPYVYAGDIGRGFDVFRWTGSGPAPWLSD